MGLTLEDNALEYVQGGAPISIVATIGITIIARNAMPVIRLYARKPKKSAAMPNRTGKRSMMFVNIHVSP